MLEAGLQHLKNGKEMKGLILIDEYDDYLDRNTLHGDYFTPSSYSFYFQYKAIDFILNEDLLQRALD